MVRSTWRVLLAFMLLGLVQSAPVSAEDVDATTPKELSQTEFSSISGTYFIKFYSPYCHHCRDLAPKWDGAYRDLMQEGAHNLKWASVNCVEYSDLCSEQGIMSYPTLRVYRNGKRIYDYSNTGPSQADLRSFAQEYTRLGDKAFDIKYETAPKDVADLERANLQAESEAKENEKKAQKEAKQMEAKQDEAKQNEELSTAHGANQERIEASGERAASEEITKDTTRPSESTEAVTVLYAGDFGVDTSVGRWFVLFTGDNCDECDALRTKWEKHDNFARSIDGINWGRVDCTNDKALCNDQQIEQVPTLRIYHDGNMAYNYEGSRDTMALRNFLQYAASADNFDGFSLSDLDAASRSGNPDTHIEGAGPNQEPNYLTGPEVQKPNYGTKKPKIMDVVQYTLDTLGKPINEDPGKLIFSDSPETHHNFRTWGASNAPPPPFLEPGAEASHASGQIVEINGIDEFETLVKDSNESWIVKFYSPKCPHCQEMAPVYEEMALQLKNKLNVAAVNCEVNKQLCRAESVPYWPYIIIYRGRVTLEEFQDKRTVSNLINYAEKAKRAQIYPIDAEADMSREIVTNNDNNLTTFVYLYDQSVMAEDWESLNKVAISIDKWGGKLYRSNSERLRELAGIKHRGTAFVLADYVGRLGEGQLKWYDYPWSNIPKKIRDSDELSKWAFRAKWTSLQYLDPISQTGFSPYIAVLLTNGTVNPGMDTLWYKHHKLAIDFRDFYVQRQIEDQDRIRIDRLRQHDQALLENKFKYARNLMRQPIEIPVVTDLAFAYIPFDDWVSRYGKFFDVSKHEPGNVVVISCYHGIYLDEFNLVPIKDDRDVLDDAVELLHRYETNHPKTTFKSIRHFKTAMQGIPKPDSRPLHFMPKPYSESHSAYEIPRFIKIFLLIGAFYLIYSKAVRPILRNFVNRRGRNSFETQPKHE